MTTATSTATVLTALQSAGLVLTLTPDRGLGVTPKARLTEPLRVLIKAHREDLVRWLGRSASNDPTARVDMGIPTSPPAPASTDWQALDKAYQAHHVNCPTCIAAGKGYGLRCGTGAALWAAYDAVDMPVHGKVSARVVGKVSPRVRTEAHTVDPLLTDTGNPASAARLALFDARGLSALTMPRRWPSICWCVTWRVTDGARALNAVTSVDMGQAAGSAPQHLKASNHEAHCNTHA
jgi:hypothetical protein